MRRASLFLTLMTVVIAGAEPPQKAMLDELRPFQAIVGTWNGDGSSSKSSGWKESIEATWGFREKDGRVSLNLYVTGGRLFESGLLTYDPTDKTFRFVGQDKKANILRFAGQPVGSQTLRLDRADKEYTDHVDRLEIKLVRGGDKLIYKSLKKVGKTYYEPLAEVEVFRDGEPMESFKEGPFCPVTGAAGRVQFEHEGKTYHAACEASREQFLAHPERYQKKAE